MNQEIIHLRGMEFYAYHGVLEEEKTLGQRFIIDLDIYAPSRAMDQVRSDNLRHTINYAEVYSVVEQCVIQKRFDLIETLAHHIADRISQDFNSTKVRIEVHKPNAPIPGIIRDISVEVIRECKE